MTGLAPWVSPVVGVRVLVPAAGAFAFSPDDALLAWVEGPDTPLVHVTELATSRTITTLDGERACALQWTSTDTLRVLRRSGADATLHVHAVPDGGELARAALPGVGVGAVSIESSMGGRAALVGRTPLDRWPPSRPSDVSYLVLGELADTVTRFDPYALVDPRVREQLRLVRCAMSPEGDQLVVVFGSAHARPTYAPSASRGDVVDTLVAFVDLRAGSSTAYVRAERGDPTLVRWIGPSRVLVALLDERLGTSIVAVEPGGGSVRVADLGPGDVIRAGAAADLHPDRDRIVLQVLRRGRTAATQRRGASLAATLRIPGASESVTAVEFITLSSVEYAGDASSRDPGGAACWDASGGLVALAHPTPREGRLSRRDAASAQARTVTHFALPGAQPHELTMEVSPRRAFAAATWLTFDRGPSDRVRRLALLGL